MDRIIFVAILYIAIGIGMYCIATEKKREARLTKLGATIIAASIIFIFGAIFL